MECDATADLIASSLLAGQGASGYLVVGDLHLHGERFVRRILAQLFPGADTLLESWQHPDIVHLEPEGKSRTIHVGTLRDRLIEPFSFSAYCGGWKAGVIVSADRMEEAASNTLLKLLEEPPEKTVFFLLTDNPEPILPTILSRVQRVMAGNPNQPLTGESAAAIHAIFSRRGNSVAAKGLAASELAALLKELKDKAEDEEIPLVRRRFYLTILAEVREWLLQGLIPRHAAFNNYQAVEDASRQSNRYLSDDAVLGFMMDRLRFP